MNDDRYVQQLYQLITRIINVLNLLSYPYPENIFFHFQCLYPAWASGKTLYFNELPRLLLETAVRN